MFLVGLTFTMAFLVPEPTIEYKYVNYCDGSAPQNVTTSQTPQYNIYEFAEEVQRVELPFFMWVLVIVGLVVLVK